MLEQLVLNPRWSFWGCWSGRRGRVGTVGLGVGGSRRWSWETICSVFVFVCHLYSWLLFLEFDFKFLNQMGTILKIMFNVYAHIYTKHQDNINTRIEGAMKVLLHEIWRIYNCLWFVPIGSNLKKISRVNCPCPPLRQIHRVYSVHKHHKVWLAPCCVCYNFSHIFSGPPELFRISGPVRSVWKMMGLVRLCTNDSYRSSSSLKEKCFSSQWKSLICVNLLLSTVLNDPTLSFLFCCLSTSQNLHKKCRAG